MSPTIALFLTVLFIIFLFWMDSKKKHPNVSKGIIIPFFWMFFAGTRFFGYWINLGRSTQQTVEFYLEGSPLDRSVFMLLIIIGLIILLKRNIKLGLLIKKNKFIFLYFLFGLVSVYWSDYSGVSFKRLIKASGTIIMVLIILTEEYPDEAMGIIIRRLAFIALPLSILFIKYYPKLGVTYFWGKPIYQGVTSHKNSLGQLCLISFIYFTWDFLYNKFKTLEEGSQTKPIIYISIYPIIMWLLYKASSATSLLCIFISTFILIFCRFLIQQNKITKVFKYGLILLITGVSLELIFNVSTVVINLLGRDPNLTTRVPMWFDLIKMSKNPIFGAGYESFWLGKRLEIIWSRWGMLHQAHNGYLETFLNLGLIGLLLLVLQIFFGFLNLKRDITKNSSLTILKLTFIVVIIIYNWTEASLFGINNMWILLLFSIVDVSGQDEQINSEGKDSNESLLQVTEG